jgi:hypothetical protein
MNELDPRFVGLRIQRRSFWSRRPGLNGRPAVYEFVGKLRSEIAKVGLKFERTLSPLVFENDRNKHPRRQNPSRGLGKSKQNTRKEV